MSRKLSEIEGIGDVTSGKFETAGVSTVEELLSAGSSQKGRAELAEKTGLTEHKVLYLVGMADLVRVKGIGGEFAELLKASGVDTVKELATRNAENLHAKIVEVNEEKHLVRHLPGTEQLAKFIEEAKTMDTMVTH